ncbi:MAG TPA: response regulator transcription factor [Longimicrobiales bacterium]
MSANIRIVIADRHRLVAEALRILVDGEPDMTVVAVATEGDALLDAVRRLAPDMVLLCLGSRDAAGLTALERLRAERLPVRVLALAALADAASMRAALEAGVDGYALKSEPAQHALFAVRQVHRGQLILPAGAKRWLLHGREDGPSSDLSRAELAVLELVADGLSNADIARRIFLSENTVKFHLRNIFHKLGTHNRTAATRWYLREHALQA